MVRSRIRNRIERQNRTTIIVSLLGVAFIVVFILKFGIPLLVNLSLFMEGAKAKQETQTAKKQTIFLSPPIVDPIPEATNSAQISISGIASAGDNIKLYINNALTAEITSKTNGDFVFKNVSLDQGQNEIKARAEKDNNQSDFSQSQIVTFENKNPSLSIDNPSDGQSFAKDDSPILVKGKTDAGVKVTVNGFWAIVDNNGNFSYKLPLRSGDNEIKIEATDDAGNKTEKNLKVKYSS